MSNRTPALRTLGVAGAIVMLALLVGWNTPTDHVVSNDDAGITADAAKAKALFKKYECASCHAVKAAGIAKTGEDDPDDEIKPPDLSKFGAKGISAKKTLKYLKKKTKLDGRKHKKKFKGDDADGQAMAEWLVTLK